ncbi:MAG TPA: alpha/beta fold hydrolase [Acidimicrobiales bacterium]|nr:alpha/beta fold hydrolase [Acidimicrobiales bacterium]
MSLGAPTVEREAARPRRRLGVVLLERHRVRLPDGRRFGVAVAGVGMPLVVAHGFAAQGVLYAQTLSRLVSMGFKVVAIDLPGHGATPLPPLPAIALSSYVDAFSAAVAGLGVRRAVFLGHSMGARVVTDVVDRNPAAAVAMVLVDPIVGGGWDRRMGRLRLDPLAWASLGSSLVADAAGVLDAADPVHTARMVSLVLRTGGLARFPAGLAPPAVAILRAPPSEPVLRRLAAAGVTATIVHGERDRPVPIDFAREAARTLRAPLVAIEEGGHSWLLRDEESLPSVMGSLLQGPLGQAWDEAVVEAGLDPATVTLTEVERAMLRPNARLGLLAPPLEFVASQGRRPPRYGWHVERPAAPVRGRR